MGLGLRDREIVRELKRKLRSTAAGHCRILIMFILLINALRYLLRIVLGMLPIAENHIKYLYNPVLYVLIYVLLFVVFIKLGNSKRLEAVDMILHKRPSRGFATVRWVIIGIGLTQILNFFMKGVFLIIEISTGLNILDVNTTVQPENINRIVTILILGILAPFMEEIFYRGTIMKNTVRYGEWFAIISTGVVCGILFVQIDQAAEAIALGIVCGFIMVKSKSVLPAIAVHMGYSLFRVTGLCFAGWGTNKKGDLIYKVTVPEWVQTAEHAVTGLAVLTIAAAILFLFIEIKKDPYLLELEDGMPGLNTKQKVTAYLTSPSAVLYMSIAMGLMIVNMVTGGIF